MKMYIDKQGTTSLCMMCGKAEETVAHALAESEKLAQKHHIEDLEAR